MKESARAALSWFRAHAAAYGADPDFFKNAEIHLHVPSGAIPKDGPSAGVTIATALASELTRRPVRGDIAMTGEITLSGRVLPVGGIKEKVLAARRAGIREVILPRQNEKNVNEDLTDELREGHDDPLRADRRRSAAAGADAGAEVARRQEGTARPAAAAIASSADVKPSFRSAYATSDTTTRRTVLRSMISPLRIIDLNSSSVNAFVSMSSSSSGCAASSSSPGLAQL